MTPPCEIKQVAEVKPLAPDHYKVQFTASRATYDKLRIAQNLLRHSIPNGDVAVVIDRALTLRVQELQKIKHAAVSRPRAVRSSSARSSRYIPAAVKREVWRRDGGQCAFAGPAGRCTERGFVEYHHRTSFADGGATTVENLELRCRAHNAFEADRWFGSEVVRETAPQFGVVGNRFRTESICAHGQSDRGSACDRALSLTPVLFTQFFDSAASKSLEFRNADADAFHDSPCLITPQAHVPGPVPLGR